MALGGDNCPEERLIHGLSMAYAGSVFLLRALFVGLVLKPCHKGNHPFWDPPI